MNLQLSEREMEVVQKKAKQNEMSPEQVVLHWMRFGQSVEVAAAGQDLYTLDEQGDCHRLFPHGACAGE